MLCCGKNTRHHQALYQPTEEQGREPTELPAVPGQHAVKTLWVSSSRLAKSVFLRVILYLQLNFFSFYLLITYYFGSG